MPRTRWDRCLPIEVKNEIDDEIRKRGYGDLDGLVAWLAERGVCIGKSALHVRCQRLKKRDAALDFLPPAAQKSALELAAALVAVARAWRGLQRHLEAEPPA